MRIKFLRVGTPNDDSTHGLSICDRASRGTRITAHEKGLLIGALRD